MVLNRLIEQAKKPDGCVGSVMLRIMNKAHGGLHKWVLSKLPMDQHTVALDIGCGGGSAIKLLDAMISNGKVYGIDYSEQAVADARKANLIAVEAGKVAIQQASVTDIPFPASSFAVATAFQTHYFWTDLPNSFTEIYRVLKQEGIFLIAAERYKMQYHMTAYKSEQEVGLLLKEIGFRYVAIHQHKNGRWLYIVGKK